MPTLVQWKWQEKTKTFLTIFHFYDDYSQPNLRTRRMRFTEIRPPLYEYTPDDPDLSGPPSEKPIGIRSVITWAPAHSELALLMDLLCYANIINGFKDYVKQDLRRKLNLADLGNIENVDFLERFDRFINALGDKIHTVGLDPDTRQGKAILSFCVELCPEYIDYLKEIVKPHLKK